MPQLGMLMGHIISYYILINVKYIVFFIFLFIGIEILCNIKNKRNKILLLNMIGFLLFGFTVSIDSFSIGICLEFISNKHLLCSLVFSIISFIFTFFGLKFGEKLAKKFKKLPQLISGIILIGLAIIYLYKI